VISLCVKLGYRWSQAIQASSSVFWNPGRRPCHIRRLVAGFPPRRSIQIRSCGICDGQRGTGAGFLRVLRFPLPIVIPPTAPHSSSIIRGWYNRPVSGRRTKWTQSHFIPRIKKN
jgi:hypothetical protein